MFVKLYRYQLGKNDFRRWKEINNKARKIYQKYGASKSVRLIKQKNNLITIIEFEYYRTKKDFLKIVKKVNQDKKIHKLFTEFLTLVPKEKIIEEEFETI